MKATQVRNGKFRVVEVTEKAHGLCDVMPVSEWLPVPARTNRYHIPSSAELVKGTQYETMFG